ncbi:MAG: hypothetical protein JW776_10360 [Candidatus Lokiarchaeota archaeon]|nr:hypothetical protein [Candidatus Lokiarchaeota archaeon]
MIAQRYRTHLKKVCPAINQCIATAKTTDSLFIVTGDIEHNVTVYNEQLEQIQQIPFKGWIRCCDAYDIDHNGNHEIAIGSGDNSVRVFRYEEEIGYSELWRYDFNNKVTTITIGDINYDGRAEVIAGGWDNSLKVFDGLTGVLLWELTFDDWVTLAKVLDVNHDGLPEVVVGLKKGQFGVINGITGECLWDHLFQKRINACDLVHLANNPYPHLLAGGDENILYIFDFEGNLVNKLETPDRILCISHGDINKDNYNEVLLTLADKRLYVYESEETGLPENTSLKIRWRATLDNVGMGLVMSDQFKDNIPRIIVTGYSKDVRILEDFFYGADSQRIQIEDSNYIPPKLSNHEKKMRDLMGTDVDLEFFNEPNAFFFPKKIETLNQLIPSQFESKSESFTFMNLKEIYENKYLLERQIEQIRNENLGKAKPLVTFPSRICNLNEIHDYSNKIEVHTSVMKSVSQKSESIPTVESYNETDTSLKIKFIEILNSTEIISSKAKMQDLMEENGFTEEQFERIFTILKDEEGILTYSRSTPRGYSISVQEAPAEITESSVTIKIEERKTVSIDIEPKDRGLGLPNEAFFDLIKENQPVSSKDRLLELAESINIDKKTAEQLIEQFKELGVIEYSRSTPRGWSTI